jgi:chitinase
VDLDIEGGGTTHYTAFISQLRSHFNGASKKYIPIVKRKGGIDPVYRYYITAAPQCPYPDGNMQEVLNAASFDAVYVQFCKMFTRARYEYVAICRGNR